MQRSGTLLLTLSVSVVSLHCAGSGGDSECRGGKCDSAGGFQSELDGRNDPIAQFLRTLSPDADGLVELDYSSLARGVAEIQGCTEASWKTFVVSDPLVEGEPFPRLISTVCSGDLSKASEFFLAASFKHPEKEDVDALELEMFAWDEEAREYRFYATTRTDDHRVEVEVGPERCQDCHLTPSNLTSERMRMTPIMNELTRPWSHWNSTLPIFGDDPNPFPSHGFEVPPEVRDADNFVSLARDRIAVAQEFEAIIRAGHAKVVTSRLRDRRERPEDDWRPAMHLLRPLFCEEQVNYSTEDFDSGKIEAHTLISAGVGEMYDKISKTESRPFSSEWEWLHTDGGKVKLPSPNVEEPIAMVPVRGSADLAYENQLVEVRTLTARQVLRIRALDWKRPVFSKFRCGLWKDAFSRMESSPPEIDPSLRNSKRIGLLYDEIMTLDGAPLTAGEEERVIALDLADEASIAALSDALSDGSLESATCGARGDDFCAPTLDEWGEMIQDYVATFTEGDPDPVRQRLRGLRDRRLCHVADFFENAPALPDFECASSGAEEESSGTESFSGLSDESKDIPDDDPTGAESRMSVGASFNVQTVEVELDIRHPWRGDLTVTLTPPSGVPAEVVSFESSDSGADVLGRFDVAEASGGDAAGTWTLGVVDGAGSDAGTLEAWSLGLNEPAQALP